jgi:hypothetical protein
MTRRCRNSPGSGQLAPDGDIAAPEFLASLLADGDDDMAAWVMSQALADRSRAEVYDEVVRPAMELVGIRWQEGQWSISVEHLASVALNQALSRVRPPENSRVAHRAHGRARRARDGTACRRPRLPRPGPRGRRLACREPRGERPRGRPRELHLGPGRGPRGPVHRNGRSAGSAPPGRRCHQGRKAGAWPSCRSWSAGTGSPRSRTRGGEPGLPLAGRRAAIRPLVEPGPGDVDRR